MTSSRPRPNRFAVALAVGLGSLALGILGVVFPVLPGWPFFFLAAIAFAGIFPPLRRLVSRVMETKFATRVVDDLAKRPLGRRMLVRSLRTGVIRDGLDSPSRCHVLCAVLGRVRVERVHGDSRRAVVDVDG